MFCKNCGQQLNDDQRFCPKCGAKIDAVAQNQGCIPAPHTQGMPVQQPVAQQPVAQQPLSQQPTPRQQPWQPGVAYGYATPSGRPSSDCKGDVVSFFNAYFVDPNFRHYADFSGRTSRKTFWLTYLASCIVSLALVGFSMLLFGLLGMAGLIIGCVLCGIFGLGLFIPQLAICCRRLRDSGKSPYLIFLGLIPFIGGILLLIFFCMPSEYDDDSASGRRVRFKAIDWSIVAAAVVLPVIGIVLGINQLSAYLHGAVSDYDGYAEDDGYESTMVVDSDVAVDDTTDYMMDDRDYGRDSRMEQSQSSGLLAYIENNGMQDSYKGDPAYFFRGYFSDGKKNFPIMMAFVNRNGNPVAVYKNMGYGGIVIEMEIASLSDNSMTLTNAANDFVIELEKSYEGELSGVAQQGKSRLSVNLTPTFDTF